MYFWRDVSTMTLRELLRYRRDRVYWLGQLLFPLLFVGLFGFGLKRVVQLPSGVDYVAHLSTGMLALIAGSGGVGAGMTLIQDRGTGFLRALQVAPIAPGSLVIGKLMARLLVTYLLLGILLSLLTLATTVRLPHLWAALVGVAAITAFFLALGVGLAARLRNLESFRFIAAVFTLPLYLLSGIFYPVETLLLPLQWVARVNPMSYGVDLLRYGLLGVHEFPLALDILMGAGLCVAALGIALFVFERGIES